MSEFHDEAFASLPDWSQTMLVLPDLVCIDTRLWVSTNRGYWSMASQVAVGLDRDLVHLTVGPRRPWATPQIPLEAMNGQLERLVNQYVEPFPKPRP